MNLDVFAFFKKSKRSSEVALRLVHSMLFDKQYKLRKDCEFEFTGRDADTYRAMDLDKHYTNAQNGACELLKTNLAVDIIALIKDRRKNLKVEQIISNKKLVRDIEEALSTIKVDKPKVQEVVKESSSSESSE